MPHFFCSESFFVQIEMQEKIQVSLEEEVTKLSVVQSTSLCIQLIFLFILKPLRRDLTVVQCTS